jgi:hypothetical protein
MASVYVTNFSIKRFENIHHMKGGASDPSFSSSSAFSGMSFRLASVQPSYSVAVALVAVLTIGKICSTSRQKVALVRRQHLSHSLSMRAWPTSSIVSPAIKSAQQCHLALGEHGVLTAGDEVELLALDEVSKSAINVELLEVQLVPAQAAYFELHTQSGSALRWTVGATACSQLKQHGLLIQGGSHI